MNVFIFGDVSVISSSTEEYLRSAIKSLNPTRILLDGLSDISIIAARIGIEIKIPYTLFLPDNKKLNLDNYLMTNAEDIMYFSGDRVTMKKHMASVSYILLYITDQTNHSNIKKSIQFITSSKKPHLIIPA